MYIIDDSIRALVRRIEESEFGSPRLDEYLKQLVLALQVSCARPEVVSRYAEYNSLQSTLQTLPLASDGYILAFDPLTQEAEFVECWRQYGIVASTGAVPSALCARVIARMQELTSLISGGSCDLSRPETWASIPVDADNNPLLSRGFFEVYHDDAIAALRQAVRVYLHYVLIWGRTDLWTSFDRLGVKLPGHEESRALPLHVDQNPNIHPHFRTVQGVLALTDCPTERGTYVGVPGSKSLFMDYGVMARNNGEYVELDLSQGVATTISAHAQACPLRAGDLISWDSRTTHANTQNVSDQTRMVAYIAAGPARWDDPAAIAARQEAFRTGIGTNVRDALMHASKKPRYTNPDVLARFRQSEQLTLLGRLIYGQENYADVTPPPA